MKSGLSLRLLWLLPALVTAGVLRDLGEISDPCRTYVLDDLVHLDCSNGDLTELPEGLDYDAQVVDLSNNNFETVPTQLQNFPQIMELNLSGNHLNRPLPSFLLSMPHLHTLNLSNNNYDIWTSNGLHNVLKYLDLSKNKINKIDDDAFTGMTKLHFLDLTENRIADLSPMLFGTATNLDTLVLNRNAFTVVPDFQSSSIRILQLSNCQIGELKVNTLDGMKSLLELDLSINEIGIVPDNFASSSLQELDLSYNEISTITDRTFSSLPNLAVLNLRGNEFKEVWSTSYFASNPYLREVHVKGNRWSCEGFGVNLLLTYEFLTREPSKVLDTASLICYSPSNVTQLTWQQAYIQTWHPDSTSTETYTLIAVMVGVIIGVLVTSCVCRGLMAINQPEEVSSNSRPPAETAALNLNGVTSQTRVESLIMRIPLREEDQPPTYDEALLMPRLNSSFHSLPDFVDEDESPSRRYRRSRSIGDLTESRPRVSDRRSVRRTVEIRIN